MDKILKLHRNDDDQPVLVNTRFMIRASRDEDDEYTNVEINEHSDEEVKETPDEIFDLITGATRSLTVEEKEEQAKNSQITAVVNSGHQIVTSEPNYDHHT